MMLTNILATSLLLTGVFYYLNTRQGYFLLNSVQYVLVFLTVLLVLLYVRREVEIPEQTPLASMLSLDPPEEDKTVPCYNVPYHLVDSEYGRKAVLAGYNEGVGAYTDPDTLSYQNPFGSQATVRRGISAKTKVVESESA